MFLPSFASESVESVDNKKEKEREIETMESTVITPNPGTAMVAGVSERAHDHEWHSSILREAVANHRAIEDRLSNLKDNAFESVKETLRSNAALMMQIERNHGETRDLIKTQALETRLLLERQENERLRDRIASIPRGSAVTIPVTV